MKKLCLLFLIPFITYSQENKTNGLSSKDLSSFDILYGYKFYRSNFYNQLNTLNNYNLSNPIKTIGIGINGQFSSSVNITYLGQLSYNQFLPTTILINDSIKGKITGFVFSHSGGGRILNTKSLLLTWQIGFNTGRLRLYQNSLLKQKNPFFSPKLGLQTKIRIGRIALSGLIEYEYDISSSRWRKTPYYRGERIYIGGFRQSGLSVQVGVGFCME